jgi:hypothetical protein
MDENDMADILQQPNNVPHKTENMHEICSKKQMMPKNFKKKKDRPTTTTRNTNQEMTKTFR